MIKITLSLVFFCPLKSLYLQKSLCILVSLSGLLCLIRRDLWKFPCRLGSLFESVPSCQVVVNGGFLQNSSPLPPRLPSYAQFISPAKRFRGLVSQQSVQRYQGAF